MPIAAKSVETILSGKRGTKLDMEDPFRNVERRHLVLFRQRRHCSPNASESIIDILD